MVATFLRKLHASYVFERQLGDRHASAFQHLGMFASLRSSQQFERQRLKPIDLQIYSKVFWTWTACVPANSGRVECKIRWLGRCSCQKHQKALPGKVCESQRFSVLFLDCEADYSPSCKWLIFYGLSTQSPRITEDLRTRICEPLDVILLIIPLDLCIASNISWLKSPQSFLQQRTIGNALYLGNIMPLCINKINTDWSASSSYFPSLWDGTRINLSWNEGTLMPDYNSVKNNWSAMTLILYILWVHTNHSTAHIIPSTWGTWEL